MEGHTHQRKNALKWGNDLLGDVVGRVQAQIIPRLHQLPRGHHHVRQPRSCHITYFNSHIEWDSRVHPDGSRSSCIPAQRLYEAAGQEESRIPVFGLQPEITSRSWLSHALLLWALKFRRNGHTGHTGT